ncbi:MAG: hypothetical protein J6X99_01225, partial [Bacteroidales bacterium]|nr:hypothetical protein [Bacteroidales bacterium]
MLLSCGTSRRSAAGPAVAKVQMPLTDSTEIKNSQKRAQEVLDSIGRVRSAEAEVPGAKATPSTPEV